MDKSGKDIILSIYDTVADQSLWPEVLDNIAHQVGAKGGILFEWNGRGHDRRLLARHCSNFYDRQILDAYILEWSAHEFEDQDLFEQYSLAHKDAIDVVDDSVIEADIERLKRRKNIEVFLKYGLLHRAACLLDKDNVTKSRFSLQYGSDRGRPDADEMAKINLLLPHVAKAINLGNPAEQLALEKNSLFEAMDRLKIGVCILDKNSNIMFKNEEFSRQVDDYPVYYTDVSGRLRMFDAKDQKRLITLQRDVLVHGQFGARPRKEAVAAGDDHFLCIELVPLNKSTDFGCAPIDGFILYSMDTSLSIKCNTLPMKHAFHLTDAEMGLVDSISMGLTNAQIAEQRNRAVATINAQVKSILAKTNCSTRTQFVRLMMNFGADYLQDR